MKQRRKIWPLITVRQRGILRVSLRPKVFPVLLILIGAPRRQHHRIRARLHRLRRMPRPRTQPRKNEARHKSPHSSPAANIHALKLRQQEATSKMTVKINTSKTAKKLKSIYSRSELRKPRTLVTLSFTSTPILRDQSSGGQYYY